MNITERAIAEKAKRFAAEYAARPEWLKIQERRVERLERRRARLEAKEGALRGKILVLREAIGGVELEIESAEYELWRLRVKAAKLV